MCRDLCAASRKAANAETHRVRAASVVRAYFRRMKRSSATF